MRINIENDATLIEKIKVNFVFLGINTINFFITLLRYFFFKKNKYPNKILIFRIGSMGDGICSIPAIMNIKNNYPNANIDILTSTGNIKGLVTIESLLDKSYYNNIIDYNNKGLSNITKLLKRNKYDLVIHLTQQGTTFSKNIRDILYFRFIVGIKSGFGWSICTLNIFRQTQNKFFIFDDERTRLNKLLLQQHDMEIIFQDTFSLTISSDDERIVNSIYFDSIKNKNLKNIAFVIGAKRPSNRWPILYFRDVAKKFCLNYNIIIIGGSEDIKLAQVLTDLPNTYSFCGKLSPLQSGVLLKKCIFTLSNDTGPMHLSYALGVPVIAIFSNRDFAHLWYPPDNKFNIVHRSPSLPCSICLSENCFNDNLCTKNISTNSIISSMERLITSIDV